MLIKILAFYLYDNVFQCIREHMCKNSRLSDCCMLRHAHKVVVNTHLYLLSIEKYYAKIIIANK